MRHLADRGEHATKRVLKYVEAVRRGTLTNDQRHKFLAELDADLDYWKEQKGQGDAGLGIRR